MLAALVALGLAFDGNWLRPLIRHHVMARSGRSVQFDDLKLRFRDGLDPTFEFRGLVIQNAPWAASKAPLIRAGRLAATVSWRSIGSDLLIVRRIELEDAQVDMERQADGLRNWRITRPDDRGPPRVRVLELDARHSTLHLVHAGIPLVLDARSTPLPAPRVLPAHADLPLTRHLDFAGRCKDRAFEGDAEVSDVLTFGTPRTFALHARASLGALQLEAAGVSNDARAIGDIDVDATLSTAATGDLWPLPEALARLRPLSAQGHVAHAGERWTGTDVRLRAGRGTRAVADVGFTGSFRSDTPRRTLQATLRDAVIDLDDIPLLRGKAPPGEASRPGPQADASHAGSTQALPFDRLSSLDADIDLRQARITGADRGFVQGLRGRAALKGGMLALTSLDIELADGHVTGSATVDASREPADVALALAARGLHIDRISETLAANGALSGTIDGRADVRSRGGSMHALVAGASGTVTLSLAEGATVSKRLDAKLGLNGGEWLRTLLDKSARVPVQCASVTLALAHGVATPRRFVFETSSTALALRGSLDLANESVDATLMPAHKKLALLALDKSIHAEGPWHGAKVSLAPPIDEPPQACDARAGR
ncbi:MAG: AsmA family protein [Burkholderiaceae bacterium]